LLEELPEVELHNLFKDAMDAASGDGLQEQLVKSDERYEVLSELGRGGRKQVFKARDSYTGREVALAVMKPPASDEAIERFLREARMLSQLQHPAIIPIYDLGISDEFGPYFVMKPAEPATFETIMKTLRGSRGKRAAQSTRWPLGTRLDLFTRVCNGVAYAHSRGILHLDLKPSNILLGRYGEALISDWGIARRIDDPEADDHFEDEALDNSRVKIITKHGLIRGTPGYMAPEQMLAAETSIATDVYGLGGVLYSLLTSLPPVEGNKFDMIEFRTLRGSIMPPSQRRPDLRISSSLDAIVMKALARNPERRYRSVQELLADLDQFRSGHTPGAYNASLLERMSLTYRRNRNLVHGLVATFLLLAGVVGFFVRWLQIERTSAIIARKEAVNALSHNAGLEISTSGNPKQAPTLETATALLERAEELIRTEDSRRALILINSVIGIAPQLARARQVRGDLYVAAMDMEAALADYAWVGVPPEDSLAPLAAAQSEVVIESPADRRRFYRNMWMALYNHRNGELMQASIDLAPLNTLPLAEQLELRMELLRIMNPDQENWNQQVYVSGNTSDVNLSGHEQLSIIDALRHAPIHKLDLSGTAVSGRQLRVLATLPVHTLAYREGKTPSAPQLGVSTLRYLDLSDTEISTLVHLVKSPLRELNFTGAQVPALSVLRNCETLRKITLDRKMANKAKGLPKEVRIVHPKKPE
jgi:serine/threonine protein kinase